MWFFIILRGWRNHNFVLTGHANFIGRICRPAYIYGALKLCFLVPAGSPRPTSSRVGQTGTPGREEQRRLWSAMAANGSTFRRRWPEPALLSSLVMRSRRLHSDELHLYRDGDDDNAPLALVAAGHAWSSSRNYGYIVCSLKWLNRGLIRLHSMRWLTLGACCTEETGFLFREAVAAVDLISRCLTIRLVMFRHQVTCYIYETSRFAKSLISWRQIWTLSKIQYNFPDDSCSRAIDIRIKGRLRSLEGVLSLTHLLVICGPYMRIRASIPCPMLYIISFYCYLESFTETNNMLAFV